MVGVVLAVGACIPKVGRGKATPRAHLVEIAYAHHVLHLPERRPLDDVGLDKRSQAVVAWHHDLFACSWLCSSTYSHVLLVVVVSPTAHLPLAALLIQCVLERS